MKFECNIYTEGQNCISYQFEARTEAMAEEAVKKMSHKLSVIIKQLKRIT